MTQAKHLILVVDDEPLVRFVAADALEDGGYAVAEAANTENAMRILEARGDIGLIFTDIQMPGNLDGLEFVRRAHGRWPHIPVILTSGRWRPDPSDIPYATRFLSKPYHHDELLAHVHDLIG